MKHEILNDEGEVINIIVADRNFVETHYQGKYREFKEDPEVLKNLLAVEIRYKRDVLLKETDWTQAADVPQAIKDKWAPYRQALRDVPQQDGFPTDVSWPIQP